MTGTPDIATLAALIGEAARSKILLSLMGGQALTATELALEAEVSPSTASAHLSKLSAAGLISRHKQGRHRYFRIADESVAELIERLCGVASLGVTKITTGPKDPALRKARVCYDHLAGELGVRLYEGLVEHGMLALRGDGLGLTEVGEDRLVAFGIDVPAVLSARRAPCRQCLDWSVRRCHLAGGVGSAILCRIYDRGWAEKDLVSRAVHFSPEGEHELLRFFDL